MRYVIIDRRSGRAHIPTTWQQHYAWRFILEIRAHYRASGTPTDIAMLDALTVVPEAQVTEFDRNGQLQALLSDERDAP